MIRFSPIFYRDEAGNPTGTPSAAPASPTAAPKAASADEIATALLKAVDDRTSRAQTSVVKSMAEQYGMSEADLKAVLDKHKAEQAEKLPEAAQKKVQEAVEKANLRLISAEVKSLGIGMGLVDADVAMQLLDREALKVDDNGEITGIKEALEALQKTKPYLFGATQKPGAMAQRVSGAVPTTLTGVEASFYAKNPGLKKPE